MHLDPIIILKSLATGFVMGAIFAFLKLPIPAPPELPGIIGIFGIFFGFIAIKAFFH